MRRDPKEFRERFLRWKNGDNPYSAGRIVESIYLNNPEEEFLGEPEHHYDFTLSEEWANNNGYYPDERGHRDDRVKKSTHPSHLSRGSWEGNNFILTEKGMLDPNYIFFGLNDGGLDPQTVLKYKDGIVLPEITVTPKNKYFYNSYDNIKLNLPKYQDGKPANYFRPNGNQIKIDEDTGELVDLVNGERGTLQLPEVTVTAAHPNSYRSSYDPNVIRNFTDWLPVVGDIGTGIDIKDAIQNLDYMDAGLLGVTAILPSVLKFPAKRIMKAGLKYAPEFTKSLYDISHLYVSPKDNPRLRRYANDVSDLLLSDEMSKRGNKGRYIRLVKNIEDAVSYFNHSNKHLFVRPIYNILGTDFVSPIPIPFKYRGLYNSKTHAIAINRGKHTPDEIRQTMYHETSHASDRGKGTSGYVGFEAKTDKLYFDMATEKRARVISILADAYHNGVDINNFDEMSNFLNIDYKNPNYSSLLNNYKTTNGTYLGQMMYGE